MTAGEVLGPAARHLTTHGSSSPRLDAELLLAHTLGLSRLDLYMRFDRPLSELELDQFRALIRRRARREPVAYLTGKKEFMGLEFQVTPAVLVPNPDTEVLVLRAVELIRQAGRLLRVADVGTGSGCVAVSVAHYAPSSEIWATDVCEDALAVAARNVAAHGVGHRVQLVLGDLLAPLAGAFDLICANLPYLAPQTQLPPEVLAQPAVALFAEDGGASLVVRLLAGAPARLNSGGRVLVEVDPSILGAALVAAGETAQSRVHRDLDGRERVLEAWWS